MTGILQNRKFELQIKSKIKCVSLLLIFISCSLNAQDFWITANGPESGSIQAMTITPAGQVLAGTDGGGIFRSINNGDDWNFAGLPNVDVQSFLVDSMGHVYAGTAEGVFRSDDNGINWSDFNNGLSNVDITSMVVGWNNIIFAGTYGGGIFRSLDSGNNWTQVGNNLDILSLAENSLGHIFAGTDGEGIYRSTDDGNTWEQINTGLTEQEIVALTVNWNFDIIFAGTHNGVFRSTNNGDTWIAVNNGLTALDVISLKIDQSGSVLTGTYEGIFRSDDDGDNWFSINNGLTNLSVKSFAIKNTTQIFAGTLGGVFRSIDLGSNWELVNSGLRATIVLSLVSKRNGDTFAGTEGGGLFRSIDTGATWEKVENGLFNPFILSLAVNSIGDIFAGTYDGVFRSIDNGDNWVQINTNLTSSDVYALAINSNDVIFAGTYDGVFRSINNGDSWQQINNGLTIFDVNALVISSNDVVFAGCDTGGIFRSVDNGNNWTLQNSGLTNTDILSLTRNSNDIIFAGSYEGVYRSADAGNNWIPVNNGLTSTDIFSLQTDFVDRIYCGNYDGIFVSNNNGDMWNQINSGLTNVDIFALCLHPAGYLFAGSYGGGVFRSQVNVSLAPPDLLQPIDSSYDLSLTPTLSWHSVMSATLYDVEVATDFNFSNIIFNAGGVTGTSVITSTLDPGTAYYWRVNARDLVNTSFWSEVWSFTTQYLPACTTQAPSLVEATSATLNAMVNPNNIKIGVGFDYGLDMTYGNYVTGSPDSMSNASGNPVSADITGLTPNTTYHYRVTATSEDGTITETGDDFAFTTGNYPSTINLVHTVDFPQHNNVTDYQSNDYRLVGLPGRSDVRIEDHINGQHGTDWDVYWDNGAANDYFIRFDGSNEFRFFEGRAYWMINRGNWNVNVTNVPTANVDGNYVAAIPLHDGWNLITNPFEAPIEWNRIQALNSVSEPIWGFEGNYNQFQFFDPYRGYYFFNNTGLSELLVPYRNILPKPIFGPMYYWQISIEIKVGHFRDSGTKISIAENASVELDELDFHKPRAFGDLPSVYFSKPEWDIDYYTFASDVRPPFSEIEKWEFSVSASQGENAELVFHDISEVPENLEIVLLDRANSKYVNLRKDNSYHFKPIIKITNFELLVGDKEYIDLEISEIIPLEFSLGKNFPNPFNPSTIIPVTLPNDSELKLVVYDVLGQEISTIFNGPKEAGKHYFKWIGTNYANQQVAAGIYLYKLIVKNEKVFVGKMVLVK